MDKSALKEIHRFTQATYTYTETKALLEDADKLEDELSHACNVTYSSCDICASTGLPASRKKIFLSHINEAFNESIQADFLVVYISSEKYDVINIVDAGINYDERGIVQVRRMRKSYRTG